MIHHCKELDIALQAAHQAGAVLKKNFGKRYRVIRKSLNEMVSEVDIQAQSVILEVLETHFPDYGIVTEEKTSTSSLRCINWIVDPLDGTHNYIAGLPFCGVSIGLIKEDEFQLGVICFPMEDRLFYAVKGAGAFLHNKRIHVSANQVLSKTIITFDNQFHLNEKSFEYYRMLTKKAFTTRIFGTATNDICLTAEGKVDGRIWVNTKVCDIAAGIVILTEAGGRITNFDGSPCTMASKKVVASNGKVHEELLAIVNR